MARPPKKPPADKAAAKAPDKQIEKIKQEKAEKLEHKDHKDWKEKELKQEKAEKLEHKDHKDWKEGKEGKEHKEVKQEKAEKLENKDHKDWKEGKELKEVDKLQKEHTKIEVAEKHVGKEKDGKELVENPGDIFQQGDPLAGAGNAQHFINQGDRPDLSGGALSGEKKPSPPKKPKG
jgi:hypothetical protein